jgi:hypothetical protein
MRLRDCRHGELGFRPLLLVPLVALLLLYSDSLCLRRHLRLCSSFLRRKFFLISLRQDTPERSLLLLSGQLRNRINDYWGGGYDRLASMIMSFLPRVRDISRLMVLFISAIFFISSSTMFCACPYHTSSSPQSCASEGSSQNLGPLGGTAPPSPCCRTSSRSRRSRRGTLNGA